MFAVLQESVSIFAWQKKLGMVLVASNMHLIPHIFFTKQIPAAFLNHNNKFACIQQSSQCAMQRGVSNQFCVKQSQQFLLHSSVASCSDWTFFLYISTVLMRKLLSVVLNNHHDLERSIRLATAIDNCPIGFFTEQQQRTKH